MLLNLLLARTKILLRFSFLFLVICKTFFIIPLVKEKIKVKLALAIPAGAPITVIKQIMNTSQLTSDKKNKILSM